MWKRIEEWFVRRYIRRLMYQHKLRKVFYLIQEEYPEVYYEDNIPTQRAFLHDLVDETTPRIQEIRDYKRVYDL